MLLVPFVAPCSFCCSSFQLCDVCEEAKRESRGEAMGWRCDCGRRDTMRCDRNMRERMRESFENDQVDHAI